MTFLMSSSFDFELEHIRAPARISITLVIISWILEDWRIICSMVQEGRERERESEMYSTMHGRGKS